MCILLINRKVNTTKSRTHRGLILKYKRKRTVGGISMVRKTDDKDDTFKKSKEKQKQRDQSVMPIDELPLEEIKREQEEERDKRKSKDKSSTDK